jgi:recombination protein RecA
MSKDKKNDRQTLEEAIAHIRKEYGDGAIIQGDVIVKGVESLPTGAITLDIALGIGGIPKGRITEIYGPESSGKTTICLEVISGIQRRGGKAAFIDVEHALSTTYARDLGVDIDKLLLSQPDSGEEALTIAEALAKTGEIDLIVVDSVAALVPQAELDGDITDANMGAQARLMSKYMRRIKGVLNKNKTAVLFTNQLREKVGIMFGPTETTSGGKALKYYASVRLDIRKIESIKSSKDETPSGNRVRVKVVKNKVATPHKIAEFDIRYGKGIDKTSAIIDLSEQFGIIKKSGSMFKFDDKSYLGRAKLYEHISSNSDIFSKLDAIIREKLKMNIKEESEELIAPEDSITIESE